MYINYTQIAIKDQILINYMINKRNIDDSNVYPFYAVRQKVSLEMTMPCRHCKHRVPRYAAMCFVHRVT